MRPRRIGIPSSQNLSHCPFVYAAHTAPRGLWRYIHGVPSQTPLHVELCTGKGNFLLYASQRHPDWIWVGVEIAPSPLWKAVRKKISNNCYFLWMDIRYLPTAFAPGEVTRFYLHFCDPWPKQRHAQRRITNPPFLRRYQQCLSTEGDLVFKTDHAGLFSYSLQNLQALGWEIHAASVDLHRSPHAATNIMTEYEERYVHQNLPIFYVRTKPNPREPGGPH
ncbi:tRNA (guanosine(46)-N7)-methyltransferase TrmB [Pasteuria penetrans]|uniref:tRNA (guanosine(46)-N7)-methyltransferase TrmB n=1 Tax=Pasteuria penetrans TaxID=86005 RepID=UPI000F95AFD6|nr:tRNA (guanosine(46)-N7)-methyltransferase TrmB [Pasteuria penetrans]